MKTVDIIIVLKNGVVIKSHVIETDIAESLFDNICEELLGDDYNEIRDVADYGMSFISVNNFLRGMGMEIIWETNLKIQSYE